jgi:hypothetical protein
MRDGNWLIGYGTAGVTFGATHLPDIDLERVWEIVPDHVRYRGPRSTRSSTDRTGKRSRGTEPRFGGNRGGNEVGANRVSARLLLSAHVLFGISRCSGPEGLRVLFRGPAAGFALNLGRVEAFCGLRRGR